MQKRILLIDDDTLVREMFTTGLALAGYVVASVGSGELALERLQTESFDMTLMDVMMPGMSGIEMLAKARTLNLSGQMGRVVALTSLDKNLLIGKLNQYGIHRCLDKSSLTPNELVKFLQTEIS